MRTASGKAEYRRVAAAIEIAVRRRVWRERLPNFQTLLEKYDISKQTLSLALRLCRENGFLVFGGRSGMLVNREALRGGVIGIRLLGAADPALESCRELIRQCGFRPVMITEEESAVPAFWKELRGRFDGLIFGQGSLPREHVLDELRAMNMPFVATQILPFYPDLDYVNFDTEETVTVLARDLRDAGFRRIALHLSGYSDGYNDKLKRMWLKIKKELSLELLPCDRVRHRDGWGWSKNAAVFLQSIVKMPEKPEALIHYGKLSDELRTLYRNWAPGYPWNMKIVSIRNPWSECHLFPGETVIQAEDRSSLLLAAFPALLEKMRSPGARPIRRLIPFAVEYLCNPPSRSAGTAPRKEQ